jgi:hypothetical protein
MDFDRPKNPQARGGWVMIHTDIIKHRVIVVQINDAMDSRAVNASMNNLQNRVAVKKLWRNYDSDSNYIFSYIWS